MSKWFTLSLAAVMVLGTAAMSMADVPSSLTSTVSCGCVATAGGGASGQLPLKCTVSPGGNPRSEDIQIAVVVRNVLGAPLAGSTTNVTAVAVGTATYKWDDGLVPGGVGDPNENPQSGLSDGGGNFMAVFDEGGIQHGSPAVYPNFDASVTAAGPGPGGPIALVACSPQLNVTSYDLDKSGLVDLLDLVLFAAQYAASSTPAICDYDWAGGVDPVDLLDLVLFASEYGASINVQ